MGRERSRPAPRERAGLLDAQSSAARDVPNSAPLPAFQADFLAARFGLDGVHARVVAELAFGEARS